MTFFRDITSSHALLAGEELNAASDFFEHFRIRRQTATICQ